MDKELQTFVERLKGMKESGAVFNKNGKPIGFVDFAKPNGKNEGFDCPIEESNKERLKRISKPKLIEVVE